MALVAVMQARHQRLARFAARLRIHRVNMEKVMRDTDTPHDRRPLADHELDTVTGGAFPIVMAQIALLNSSSSGVDHQSLSISKLFD
jgi:hypothetical protein